MLAWVIYDISSNRDRTKIAKTCKEYGLIRVQKSVFFGDISPSDLDSLGEKSSELIDKDSDAVFLIPISDNDFKKKRIIGKSFDEDLARGQKNTLSL